MSDEELRSKRANDYINDVISGCDELPIIVGKIDTFVRDVWKNSPKDVNFLAWSLVERAKQLHHARHKSA